MSMSKKHFEEIASIIKKNNYDQETLALDDVVIDLCNFFLKDNPNFNPNRFIVACGITFEDEDNEGIPRALDFEF